jgi:hypothetical protein
MKKLFIILFTAVSFAACKSAGKNPAGTSTADSTTIQWPDSTYRDFGKVKEGGIVEVAFRFKNTGDHNLIIADVRPGCGCTDPEKPEEPIAPGKEGVIKAKFKSQGQHKGENRKYISVTANTKPSRTTELSFSVEVTN